MRNAPAHNVCINVHNLRISSGFYPRAVLAGLGAWAQSLSYTIVSTRLYKVVYPALKAFSNLLFPVYAPFTQGLVLKKLF